MVYIYILTIHINRILFILIWPRLDVIIVISVLIMIYFYGWNHTLTIEFNWRMLTIHYLVQSYYYLVYHKRLGTCSVLFLMYINDFPSIFSPVINIAILFAEDVKLSLSYKNISERYILDKLLTLKFLINSAHGWMTWTYK